MQEAGRKDHGLAQEHAQAKDSRREDGKDDEFVLLVCLHWN